VTSTISTADDAGFETAVSSDAGTRVVPPGESLVEEDREEATAVMSTAALAALSEDAEDAHVRTVFDEFVATRKQCGENASTLTLEKFRVKLHANKQSLIAKYGCRSARFSVYVKDGKAAIKATPIR
jgi:hypothetical protein